MDDDALYSQTLDKIVRKLRGKYGFKRFLRDGFRTANEDQNRRYYKPAEMKVGAGETLNIFSLHSFICYILLIIYFIFFLPLTFDLSIQTILELLSALSK